MYSKIALMHITTALHVYMILEVESNMCILSLVTVHAYVAMKYLEMFKRQFNLTILLKFKMLLFHILVDVNSFGLKYTGLYGQKILVVFTKNLRSY